MASLSILMSFSRLARAVIGIETADADDPSQIVAFAIMAILGVLLGFNLFFVREQRFVSRKLIQIAASYGSLAWVVGWSVTTTSILLNPKTPSTEVILSVGYTTVGLPLFMATGLRLPFWQSSMAFAVLAAPVVFSDHVTYSFIPVISLHLLGGVGVFYMLEWAQRTTFLHELEVIHLHGLVEGAEARRISRREAAQLQGTIEPTVGTEASSELDETEITIEKAICKEELGSKLRNDVDAPVQIRNRVVRELWGRTPNLTINVDPQLPEWLLLPWAFVSVIMGAAVQNAITHGRPDGLLTLTFQLRTYENRLSISLRNEPGPHHMEALALQEQRGENFIFSDELAEEDLSSITTGTGSFQGRIEMQEVAAQMDGRLSLIFHATLVVFSLDLPLHPNTDRKSVV